jgi:hypothetical protein
MSALCQKQTLALHQNLIFVKDAWVSACRDL